MYDRLESELELVCYCNAILFKLGQFRTAKLFNYYIYYYLISISEQDVETGKQEEEEIAAKVFIYLFFLCK